MHTTQSAPKLQNSELWKTVVLGRHKNADEYRRAIRSLGTDISIDTSRLLDRPAFKWAAKETELDLVLRSLDELGLERGAKYSDICSSGRKLDLELCPPEVGPALCVQYGLHRRGEEYDLTMEVIPEARSGFSSVLRVGRGNKGVWLGSSYGPTDGSWPFKNRLVFVRPRT